MNLYEHNAKIADMLLGSNDEELLSDCCGAGPENDLGICPQCKEHCEFTNGDEV